MANKSNQKQEAGDNSTNIQSHNMTINQGVTYSEVKEIATDVFKSNFIQLKQEAAILAQERAEEVTDKALAQLREKHPDSISEFKQPAMQDALFTVQKQYAMSGDEDLGDLLVDILVDRASEPNRNILQIVLDESLHIAHKLTTEQLDTLTLIFLLVGTRRLDLQTYQALILHFEKRLTPFIDNLSDSRSDYMHIEYLGCGHIRTGDYGKLEKNLGDTYRAYFSNGFTKKELINTLGSDKNLDRLIMPCFHDRNKLQINALDEKVLEQVAEESGLTKETTTQLKQLFKNTTKPEHEIKSMLLEALPRMQKIFDVWNNSLMNKTELTGVGIAIAHANYRRKTGDTMDLSIWIK